MTNYMSLTYIFEEKVAPWRFSFIIHPQLAVQRIRTMPPSSVSAMLSRQDTLRSRNGANPNQSGRDIRTVAAVDLERGTMVAIDDSFRLWSPVTALFFIDKEGRLQLFSANLSVTYPVSSITRRYEEMVGIFGKRPPPTDIPRGQFTRTDSPMRGEEPSAGGGRGSRLDEPTRPLTKAERWQERKNLISKGQRSVYPDAQTAANRLAENNVAVEKAKLAQNVYGRAGQPINALESMPDVPEGWVDISNDKDALSAMGLTPKMLADSPMEPDFFARVYAPDEYVFGKDMNPTVVFRGTRPDKMIDWANNAAQGMDLRSSYYKNAVGIGRKIAQAGAKVDIAGHSLGGGLASAAGMASGKSTWTFNSAGLNSGTITKYGGQLIGDGSAISAYRVNGEMLTKIQEVSYTDLRDTNFDTSAFALKAGVSNMFPDAIGKPHALSGGTGNMLDKHGMSQVIDCIEAQKDEDIGIIKSRV
ncbi:phospholipase [Kosakonia sp.]|uniref:phospholipase n=1 Tax=Kosakonia sp. TaxID=1916651 RepID=UPI0028AE24EF|nr:phospholipase [Kosakonia sp.]